MSGSEQQPSVSDFFETVSGLMSIDANRRTQACAIPSPFLESLLCEIKILSPTGYLPGSVARAAGTVPVTKNSDD